MRAFVAVATTALCLLATFATAAPVVVERPAGGPVATNRVAEPAGSGPVDPQVARDASDAIGDDIDKIQRHVTRMRSHAEKLGDKDSLANLDKVEKQLGVARRAHATLHAHHAEDVIDPKTAMGLAQQVNDALRAAHSEHDKLMKRLHETDSSAGN